MVGEKVTYLDEEYSEALATLVEDHPGFSSDSATEVYLEECAKFGELFTDGTPKTAVQRIAFQQTEKRIRENDR